MHAPSMHACAEDACMRRACMHALKMHACATHACMRRTCMHGMRQQFQINLHPRQGARVPNPHHANGNSCKRRQRADGSSETAEGVHPTPRNWQHAATANPIRSHLRTALRNSSIESKSHTRTHSSSGVWTDGSRLGSRRSARSEFAR